MYRLYVRKSFLSPLHYVCYREMSFPFIALFAVYGCSTQQGVIFRVLCLTIFPFSQFPPPPPPPQRSHFHCALLSEKLGLYVLHQDTMNSKIWLCMRVVRPTFLTEGSFSSSLISFSFCSCTCATFSSILLSLESASSAIFAVSLLILYGNLTLLKVAMMSSWPIAIPNLVEIIRMMLWEPDRLIADRQKNYLRNGYC